MAARGNLSSQAKYRNLYWNMHMKQIINSEELKSVLTPPKLPWNCFFYGKDGYQLIVTLNKSFCAEILNLVYIYVVSAQSPTDSTNLSIVIFVIFFIFFKLGIEGMADIESKTSIWLRSLRFSDLRCYIDILFTWGRVNPSKLGNKPSLFKLC